MTIAIKVTNSDSRENAIVEVRRARTQDKSRLPFVEPAKQLKGGESVTEYVHSGQSLIIEEIQNG